MDHWSRDGTLQNNIFWCATKNFFYRIFDWNTYHHTKISQEKQIVVYPGIKKSGHFKIFLIMTFKKEY